MRWLLVYLPTRRDLDLHRHCCCGQAACQSFLIGTARSRSAPRCFPFDERELFDGENECSGGSKARALGTS